MDSEDLTSNGTLTLCLEFIIELLSILLLLRILVENTDKIPVYGFDIFDALINFWGVLLSRPNDLADRLRELKPTKEEYEKVKEILLRWDYTQDMLKDMQLVSGRFRSGCSLSVLTAPADLWGCSF